MQTKPDVNDVWASAGDKTPVSQARIEGGWLDQETPLRQDENWLENRRDEFMKHVNEQGICVWDAVTEYSIGSWAKGSDDETYISLVATNTGNDPVSSPTEWESMTDRFGVIIPSASEIEAGLIEIATQAETDAGTDDARAITPLKLKNSPYAFDGLVALEDTRTTTGTWTITGLIIGRPVIIGFSSTQPSATVARFDTITNTAFGQLAYGTFHLGADLNYSTSYSPSMVLVPTATSISLNVVTLTTNSTLTAYQ